MLRGWEREWRHWGISVRGSDTGSLNPSLPSLGVKEMGTLWSVSGREGDEGADDTAKRKGTLALP